MNELDIICRAVGQAFKSLGKRAQKALKSTKKALKQTPSTKSAKYLAGGGLIAGVVTYPTEAEASEQVIHGLDTGLGEISSYDLASSAIHVAEPLWEPNAKRLNLVTGTTEPVEPWDSRVKRSAIRALEMGMPLHTTIYRLWKD